MRRSIERRMNVFPSWFAVLFLLSSSVIAVQATEPAANSLPGLEEALASNQDLWGLAAIRASNGPSYEFFEKLLPPLRYVNAAFHYYPIILSAPSSAQKVRLVSNGSAINPHAELKTWKEKGVPVSFFVGEKQEAFGADLRKIDGPHFEKGWLPIVQIAYTNDGTAYAEETFASVEPALAAHGVAFVQFKAAGQNGRMVVHVVSPAPLKLVGNKLLTTNSQVLVWLDKLWQWNEAKQTLTTPLSPHARANLAIASTPLPAITGQSFKLSPREYEKQKARCIAEWKKLLARGMDLELPETVVNNAWRSLIVANYMIAKGDQPNYGWGNAYERLYEAESGDTARAFLLWNYDDDVRRMVPPLLDYTNDKLVFHNAGFKLQALAHYYWMTRDAAFLRSIKDRWQKYLSVITDGREAESGLAPRENYCGDIFTKIYSLNSNAAAWRGLRDFAAVLADMGEAADAQQLTRVANEYRSKILAAVEKSERRDIKPAFIPIALFGEEKPYEVLTSSMVGSYWDLMAPYVLDSGIFPPSSERERAMLDYLQERGGVFMGMIRFDQHSGLFANGSAVDDLYGLRYVDTLLRLDETDRALVSFYGKLAQGMTRETFIDGEGTGLKPLDEFGRPMYLPPNSSGNAHFLWTLRHLLIQDRDSNDDGKPDTLRLLFATPKNWLADGKTIRIERALTSFGEFSINVKSRLKQGEVIAEIQPPTRQSPAETFLRIRLPDDWKITSSSIIQNSEHLASTALTVDEKGTVKLPPLQKRFVARFQVSHNVH